MSKNTYLCKMKQELIITADGSSSLRVPEWNECYHSTNGALQESLHVFIDAGFNYAAKYVSSDVLQVLEVGFGTGLNAFLTLLEAERQKTPVFYESLEKYPLPEHLTAQLNYASFVSEKDADYFPWIHQAAWEQEETVSAYFTLAKRAVDVLDYCTEKQFGLIYFDAFAPTIQPDLWTVAVFQKLYAALSDGGVLVTYSAKGSVKEALREAGFRLERLPGAAGKRHMLRGQK